ncbi:hypothetical protein BpHYR1_017250 [Brachionus plicatilis]|uniref:Uncharacterized protein n=1 Tax=Brachionus plicatilis TaxID=10195 RepID=A0A3M7SPN4_BRAPC|nr:hypothetical protein BpHYR1_017250 [Brachionus plicatilis]
MSIRRENSEQPNCFRTWRMLCALTGNWPNIWNLFYLSIIKYLKANKCFAKSGREQLKYDNSALRYLPIE